MNAAEYVLAGGLAVAGVDKSAIVSDDECVSYGELAVRVARLTAALREAGMHPGDRVAILMCRRSSPVMRQGARIILKSKEEPAC
jgi:non-ribosomal peptide synthetase component E (peptide arylation enzyme)